MVEIVGRCIILNKRLSIMMIFVGLILTICISTLSIILYKKTTICNIDKICVPTREVAIELAEVICKSAYPQFDYKQIEWECFYNDKDGMYEENTWIVYCCSTENNNLGGGKPEIHIRRDNGQIVFISLMA